MTTAKQGDTVQVHYTGTLADGTVFDSSVGKDPISFEVGSGQVIPGFDAGVTGMAVGDKKDVLIPCEKAYGPRFDQAVIDMPREQFPSELEPEVGMVLRMQHQSGALVVMSIVAVEGDVVKLDGNHPLAGKDLSFALELVAIG